MSTEESTKAVEGDERFLRAVESLRQLAALHAVGQLPTEYASTLRNGAVNLWRFYYGQAWQRLNGSFRETLRNLPNTITLEIIDAFNMLATNEARSRVEKETGYQIPEISLAISETLIEEAETLHGVQLIVKPEIHTREPGRRQIEGYNRAFARIYFTRECKPVEAFELYLTEEGIHPKDEGERATIWDAFNAAMKRRRKDSK